MGSEPLEVSFGFFESREKAFLGLKLPGVNAATAGFDPHGMLQVEHLVVKQIFDRTAWGVVTVEDSAHDNGVVCSVVMAQHSPGMVSAPGKYGAAEQPMKEAHVERVEDLVEIVVMSYMRENSLPAAGLTDVFGLS